ncbi:MAG TPA: class I SAM-dependent methyltransferase [Trebonia sp.]
MTIDQSRDLLPRQWVGHELLHDVLDLPRAIAAEIVAADRPGSRLVIDIGSGPDTLLDRFLAALPDARGVWADVSSAMAALARDRLASYAPRVDFQLADMTDLRGLPFPADVIASSHASHHLSPRQLRQFYAEAHARLAPGGCLVNLDHTHSVSAEWDKRLRAASTTLTPHAPAGQASHDAATPPTTSEHLGALRAAGFTDLDMPWRVFPTCLFMARRGERDG